MRIIERGYVHLVTPENEIENKICFRKLTKMNIFVGKKDLEILIYSDDCDTEKWNKFIKALDKNKDWRN